MVYWFILVLAGIFEVLWAVGLKLSEGFTNLLWSVITIAGMAISMGLLAYVVKFLPLGTAYAVWTGIGATGTAILGIYLFQESKEPIRLFFICLIIVGIIGLKFVSASK